MPNTIIRDESLNRLMRDAGRTMTYTRMYGGNIGRVRSAYIVSDERARLDELRRMWFSMEQEERQDNDELKDEIVEALYDVLDNGEIF